MDGMSTNEPTTTEPAIIPEWTVADRLIKARHHAGLDQPELAEAIGIARSSLSAYENGHRVPRRPVLLSWALATGVPLAWLETGDGTSPRMHALCNDGQLDLFHYAAGATRPTRTPQALAA